MLGTARRGACLPISRPHLRPISQVRRVRAQLAEREAAARPPPARAPSTARAPSAATAASELEEMAAYATQLQERLAAAERKAAEAEAAAARQLAQMHAEMAKERDDARASARGAMESPRSLESPRKRAIDVSDLVSRAWRSGRAGGRRVTPG